MTLFEKIYWTLLVINIVLAIISLFQEIEIVNVEIDLEWLYGFLGLQIIFTVGYWILKLILWIWGIHISLFPSIG